MEIKLKGYKPIRLTEKSQTEKDIDKLWDKIYSNYLENKKNKVRLKPLESNKSNTGVAGVTKKGSVFVVNCPQRGRTSRYVGTFKTFKEAVWARYECEIIHGSTRKSNSREYLIKMGEIKQ